MINFKNATFLTSCVDVKSIPQEVRRSVLLLGRSNVGKSTLINTLLGQKIAFASKKAGKTKLINVFDIDKSFFLLDAPGYGSTGYATMNTISFSTMVEDSIKCPKIEGLVLLLDLRREIGDDDQLFIDYLKKSNKRTLFILTKADTMNQKELSLAKKRAMEAGISELLISDGKKTSIDNLRSRLSKLALGE